MEMRNLNRVCTDEQDKKAGELMNKFGLTMVEASAVVLKADQLPLHFPFTRARNGAAKKMNR